MFNGFNISTISDCYFGNTHVSEIYYGLTKLWPSSGHDYRQDYLTIESLENNNVIKYRQSSTTGTIYKISWSYDTVTWTEVTPTENGVTLATLSAGQKIYLKGDNTTYARGSAYNNITSYCYFASTGTFNLSGNIMSLLQSQRTGDFRTEWYIPNVQYTFTNMFRGTKVVNAENLVLPATTIRSNSYNSMFRECTNLVTPPTLGLNTTTGQYSYLAMFSGCSSLTSAPELHTTTMNTGCYRDMFHNCSSLTSAPALPATTLANECYRGMFLGCSSLTSAPALPATTLASVCYQQMFAYCKSLTMAPELPAKTLVNNCYQQMFQHCSKLNYIKCLATDISANNCTLNWVQDVAATGTFVKDASMNSWTIGNNGIPTGWVTNHDYSQDYLTFTALESGTFSFSVNNIQYSLDNGSTWTTLTAGSSTPTVNAGNKIIWKATGLTPNSSYIVGTFSATGNFNATGNIMSLYYGDNFVGQTDLTGKNHAFRSLFQNCTKLQNIYNLTLPATTLSAWCYRSMFQGCTSITTLPKELPANTLSQQCYQSMFQGCTGLTIIPNNYLHSTAIAYGCYMNMFQGCTSLTTAPELPATTLYRECYQNLFKGCTSLTTSPELPATTLVYSCYKSMFQDCTHLNYIKCLATNISATNCTYAWVQNVAATGTFVKDASMNSWTIGDNGIPTGWIVENDGQHDYSQDYLTFTPLESGTFTLRGTSGSLLYSLNNGSTWTTLTGGSSTPTVSAGNKVLWKQTQSGVPNIFSSSCRFNVSGNIMSLLYGDNFVGQTSLSNNRLAFKSLFDYCNKLIDASNLILPAITLSEYCYDAMFNGCTSLTTAPALPATTLDNYCYQYMFMGCKSLTTAPALPALYVPYYSYHSMFSGCTSLTTAPNLPATKIKKGCYLSMFNGCTSLTTAPDLPATSILDPTGGTDITKKGEIYEYMFAGCTSLTTAPATLPIMDLSYAKFCYRGMFAGCTSLTTAPELPATKIEYGCYMDMFAGCTSLTTAPSSLPAIIPLTPPSGILLTDGSHCYRRMFQDCTSLATAPELLSTKVADYCYYEMFAGCTHLNYIKCLAKNVSANNCAYNWVKNVATTGTFVKDASMSSWPSGESGIPTNWTVQNA